MTVLDEKSPQLSFKSINSLLESHAKESLFSLRREFPEYPRLFEPEFKLGASRDAEEAVTSDPGKPTQSARWL